MGELSKSENSSAPIVRIAGWPEGPSKIRIFVEFVFGNPSHVKRVPSKMIFGQSLFPILPSIVDCIWFLKLLYFGWIIKVGQYA